MWSWSAVLGKCIPMMARNVFFIQGVLPSFSFPSPCNKSLFIKCHSGNWWCQIEESECVAVEMRVCESVCFSVCLFACNCFSERVCTVLMCMYVYVCVCVHLYMLAYTVCVSVCVCVNAFIGRAASTHRVAGLIPRDPEGKAPIDGWKTPTVLCFLCAQSPLSLQPLWAHTLVWKQCCLFSFYIWHEFSCLVV